MSGFPRSVDVWAATVAGLSNTVGSSAVVNNSAELQAAFRDLSAGSGGTIALNFNPTHYSLLIISPSERQPAIRITSNDPDNPAMIQRMVFNGRDNITVDGLIFDSSSEPDRPASERDLEFLNCENITVDNNTFVSFANGRWTNSTAKGGPDGGGGFAIKLWDNVNVLVQRNDISRYGYGIYHLRNRNMVIERNHFHQMQADPVQGGGWVGGRFNHNIFSNMFGSTQHINHDDMFQIWGTGLAAPWITRDLEIAHNLFMPGGAGSQTIFIGNELNNGAYTRLRIHNNVIHNGDGHGISCYDCDDLEINHNTLINNKDAVLISGGIPVNLAPKINVQDSKNVRIHHNITSAVEYASSENVSDTDNRIINYDLAELAVNFVNAKAGETADARDLELLADSPFVGHGAALSQPAATQPKLRAVIQVHADPANELALTLRADLTQDASGYVGADRATFKWTFDDGSTATGIQISKTAGGPGFSSVTLAVKTATEADVIKRKFEVEDIRLAALDMNDPLEDLSARKSIIAVIHPAEGKYLRKGVNRTGASFYVEPGAPGSSRISLSYSNTHFFNLKTFSTGMLFKKEDHKVYTPLVYFNLNHNIHCNADGSILGQMWNDAGAHYQLQSRAGVIRDNNWHQVYLVFNGRDIFINADGVTVATRANVVGPTNGSGYGQPMTIPTNLNSGGGIEVDDFLFTKKAFTAEELSKKWRAYGL